MKNFSLCSPLAATLLFTLILAPLRSGLSQEYTLTPKQKKIEAYLKDNYCETEQDPASPNGNDGYEMGEPDPEGAQDQEGLEWADETGGEEFCFVKRHIEINPIIKVLAEDKIEVRAPMADNPGEKFVWESNRKGRVPKDVKEVIFKKLIAQQLPPEEVENTLFQIWKINLDEDSFEEMLVHAFYKKLAGSEDLKGYRCEITAVLDKKNRSEAAYSVSVLHKTLYKEVDLEADAEIQKTPYDIQDVDGDRKLEIVLFAEGFEASWLEVYSKRTQGWYLSFKGLGFGL